jgi:hypothetical protein
MKLISLGNFYSRLRRIYKRLAKTCKHLVWKTKEKVAKYRIGIVLLGLYFVWHTPHNVLSVKL